MKKIIIAFDLDGVIIDKPPLIPKKLLERLFRGKTNHNLHYRFPKSKLEQLIRKISHFYLFRPPIKENIDFVKNLSQNSKYEIYAVSGRYSFIKDETEAWFKKRKMDNVFKQVFLNQENEQPHLFKEKKLREIGAQIFIDDDGLLADYLAEKLKNIKIFCFSKNPDCKIAKNINKLEYLFA